jgi:hypothetical protein
MRRDLAAGAVVAALAAAGSPAAAELRTLFAADSYLSTTGGLATPRAADLAWSAHLEWRAPEQAAVLDWVSRESLIGGGARRELHELSYVERRIPGLELTLGRFRVPGGFWLIADGAGLAVRSGGLVAGVFGGSRSFTNGRAETLLTRSPGPLPLVGASVSVRGDLQAALAYTYTADRLTLYRGDGMTATSRQPEQFLDAELASTIGAHGFVTIGATIGSRYLVSYPLAAARIFDDPKLTNVWFGSQAAYAVIAWRLDAWRLDATVSALRTKLGQVGDPALASISGSFVEGSARARWRRGRTWRLDGRYRLRLWADRSRTQRAMVSAGWQRGALDVQARAGLDAHHSATTAPGVVTDDDDRAGSAPSADRGEVWRRPPGVTRTSVVYRASVGRKTTESELAIGVAAVAALGDELAAGRADDPGDQRAPYTLEARSYAFVHLFASRGGWFVGIDGELQLRGDGVRALFQIGCSL